MVVDSISVMALLLANLMIYWKE